MKLGVQELAALKRMNKLEAEFFMWLKGHEPHGAVLTYECVKLRIGHNCWYTPDFEVLSPEDATDAVFVIYYEVKGFWRDDARVKIKAAAQRYPSRRFIAVTRDKQSKAWRFEHIKAA